MIHEKKYRGREKKRNEKKMAAILVMKKVSSNGQEVITLREREGESSQRVYECGTSSHVLT